MNDSKTLTKIDSKDLAEVAGGGAIGADPFGNTDPGNGGGAPAPSDPGNGGVAPSDPGNGGAIST